MVIRDTCKAISMALADFIEPPKMEDDWRRVAADFQRSWNFPNCIGAIDGKHVQIKAPNTSGSLYWNYKHTFSTVLLAVCDADYCFLYIDYGSYGQAGDAGIFSSSALGKALESKALNLPPEQYLPGTETAFPFVFIGDQAFPLKRYMMRPYPEKATNNMQRKVYNYRLCRARRTIENAFGILSARWRIFRKPVEADPKQVDSFVLAACSLHNFVRRREKVNGQLVTAGVGDAEDRHGNVSAGNWRELTKNDTGLREIRQIGGNRPSADAKELQEVLTEYFTSAAGVVSWQKERISRGYNPVI